MCARRCGVLSAKALKEARIGQSGDTDGHSAQTWRTCWLLGQMPHSGLQVMTTFES